MQEEGLYAGKPCAGLFKHRMKDSVIITQRKLEKNIIHMDVYIEN